MLQRDDLIESLIKNIMGEPAGTAQYRENARQAYEMGLLYGETGKFNSSHLYHNYRFCLDDGSKISSAAYFNQFMSRMQTYAYMEAEKAAKVLFSDDSENQDRLFHLVRDRRSGINGVFKAVMSPQEPQQLNVNDFVLVIAAFCCGVMSFYQQ